MNDRFGTSFGLFEHTGASSQDVLRMISESQIGRGVGPRVLAIPTNVKNKMKTERNAEYAEEDTLRPLAEDIYRELSGHSKN